MAILAPPCRPFSPGFPPIDAARGDGGATIAVTMRYAPLAFPLGRFTPVLQIDGRAVPASWGRVTTPVALGEHHVHVHVPYSPARFGAAEATVVALPDHTAELEYRAPLLAFLRGALGPPPQRYPGLALTVILLIIAVALTLCGCLGVLTATGRDGPPPAGTGRSPEVATAAARPFQPGTGGAAHPG
ncbi:hypothetical protein [Actinoplanes teichomyceticus]|uniref:Uncharacterized protein n=1 Tax=Actinoplanes teichomyceticus TaxID=1867 RepID=A0A561WKV7_ACTTI|nr:hypothetical protein [Actinoplanes teichomyceticus]TWG24494.1 hypothetical protein FHX34_1021050 [Actinoplanes teichomyceticus]GIF17235.1 hypothetical protein Ate01nite_72670 [Actinoplanes teichomyceticus]